MTAPTIERKAKGAARAEQEQAPKQEEQIKPLTMGVDAFSHFDQWNVHHRLVVPNDCRARHLHGTDIWGTCADRMTAGDQITAITSDATRLLLGIVTAGDRAMSVRSPRVHILHEIVLPAASDMSTGLPPDHKVRLATPGDGMGEGWLGVRQKPGEPELFLCGPYAQHSDCEFAVRNHASLKVGTRANFL